MVFSFYCQKRQKDEVLNEDLESPTVPLKSCLEHSESNGEQVGQRLDQQHGGTDLRFWSTD